MSGTFFDPEKLMEGFASSPDRFKSYGSPLSQNQLAWQNFCNETINSLAKQLPGFPEKKPELSETFYRKNRNLLEQYEFLETKVGCAYAFLADQRSQIAKELKHGEKLNRTDWYGCIRSEVFKSSESVASDNETLWENQKDKIFENCHNLVKNAFQGDLEYKEEVNTKHYSIQFEEANMEFDDRERRVTLYTIQIKSPEEKVIEFNNEQELHSTRLSKIYLLDIKDWYVLKLEKPDEHKKIEAGNLYLYQSEKGIELATKNASGNPEKIKISEQELGKNFESVKKSLEANTNLTEDDLKAIFNITSKYGYFQNKSLMKLSYTEISKYHIKGDFLLADKYYSEMEKAGEEKNVQVFLENAGRISHLLAHLLPIKLGNASCVELLIRGLAKDKGLDLGPFSFKEKIGWDWKALVTPNREEYATWYAKHVFANTATLQFTERKTIY